MHCKHTILDFQTAGICIAYAQHRNWVQRLKHDTHMAKYILLCTNPAHHVLSRTDGYICSSCYEQMKAFLLYLLPFSLPHHCSHCMEDLHECLPPIDNILIHNDTRTIFGSSKTCIHVHIHYMNENAHTSHQCGSQSPIIMENLQKNLLEVSDCWIVTYLRQMLSNIVLCQLIM